MDWFCFGFFLLCAIVVLGVLALCWSLSVGPTLGAAAILHELLKAYGEGKTGKPPSVREK